MNSNRNRSEGWQHAKLTGHQNEKLIAELTENNLEIQKRLLYAANMPDCSITDVCYGGLCEESVDSVLGGKTKSKTDMWLLLSNGKRINVSIKKDEGGQVFLIGIDRFIQGFATQYKKHIPKDVKRAISLYFGSAQDIPEIIKKHSGKNKILETRKHRLVADTLKYYDSSLYIALLNWINENSADLFDFCFSKGLSASPDYWADLIWYKNLIGENNLDTIINIHTIADKICSPAEYGTKNGGSTIRLPFGFVQWHSPRKIIPGEVQFHHSYQKILKLTE